MTTRDLNALREQFIEAAGHAAQSLGFGRIIGQIYMHAYFNREPVSLDHLTRDLGISKGSASTAVRQLEAWGALRRIWMKGDRKDYYEPRDEFGRIIRKALIDMIGQRMETADHLIEQAEGALNAKPKNGATADEELLFFRQRVGKLRDFRKRAQGLLDSPVIRMLMK
jgi:DNA-binding transcriptional regulator GbsR (MarR family)